MSAHERTGWRDEDISKRHRQYGFNCPAVDLDFLLMEYNSGKPAALIEYKARQKYNIDLQHPSYTALKSLADASNIPFLIAFYNSDTWSYTIRPGNTQAMQFFSFDETLTEREYVTRLHEIRHKVVEENILSKLNDKI